MKATKPDVCPDVPHTSHCFCKTKKDKKCICHLPTDPWWPLAPDTVHLPDSGPPAAANCQRGQPPTCLIREAVPPRSWTCMLPLTSDLWRRGSSKSCGERRGWRQLVPEDSGCCLRTLVQAPDVICSAGTEKGYQAVLGCPEEPPSQPSPKNQPKSQSEQAELVAYSSHGLLTSSADTSFLPNFLPKEPHPHWCHLKGRVRHVVSWSLLGSFWCAILERRHEKKEEKRKERNLSILFK